MRTASGVPPAFPSLDAQRRYQDLAADVFGVDSPTTLASAVQLASSQAEHGAAAEAVATLQQAATFAQADWLCPAELPLRALFLAGTLALQVCSRTNARMQACSAHAPAHCQRRMLDCATAAFRAALQQLAELDSGHPFGLAVLNRLAACLRAAGRNEEACSTLMPRYLELWRAYPCPGTLPARLRQQCDALTH